MPKTPSKNHGAADRRSFDPGEVSGLARQKFGKFARANHETSAAQIAAAEIQKRMTLIELIIACSILVVLARRTARSAFIRFRFCAQGK